MFGCVLITPLSSIKKIGLKKKTFKLNLLFSYNISRTGKNLKKVFGNLHFNEFFVAVFTCSKLTMKTPEQSVKSVQRKQ